MAPFRSARSAASGGTPAVAAPLSTHSAVIARRSKLRLMCGVVVKAIGQSRGSTRREYQPRSGAESFSPSGERSGDCLFQCLNGCGNPQHVGTAKGDEGGAK